MEIDQGKVTELVVQITFALIAAAIAVRSVVEVLKARKIIKDGQAGYANEALSFVIVLGAFVLTHMGAGDAVAVARSVGEDFAPLLTSAFVITVLAWVIHRVAKRVEGRNVPAPLG